MSNYIKPPASEMKIELRKPTSVYPKRKLLTLKNILRVLAVCSSALAFLFSLYVLILVCGIALIK